MLPQRWAHQSYFAYMCCQEYVCVCLLCVHALVPSCVPDAKQTTKWGWQSAFTGIAQWSTYWFMYQDEINLAFACFNNIEPGGKWITVTMMWLLHLCSGILRRPLILIRQLRHLHLTDKQVVDLLFCLGIKSDTYSRADKMNEQQHCWCFGGLQGLLLWDSCSAVTTQLILVITTAIIQVGLIQKSSLINSLYQRNSSENNMRTAWISDETHKRTGSCHAFIWLADAELARATRVKQHPWSSTGSDKSGFQHSCDFWVELLMGIFLEEKIKKRTVKPVQHSLMLSDFDLGCCTEAAWRITKNLSSPRIIRSSVAQRRAADLAVQLSLRELYQHTMQAANQLIYQPLAQKEFLAPCSHRGLVSGGQRREKCHGQFNKWEPIKWDIERDCSTQFCYCCYKKSSYFTFSCTLCLPAFDWLYSYLL